MRYFKKIIGEHIYLSPINMDDLELYTKWMNDAEVVGNLGNYHRMLSLNNEKTALETLTKDGQNYAIVLNEGDLLIGGVSLNEVNHMYRTATAGIFIGESEHRSRGYGTEAMRLMVEYGFKTLNLHNIMLTVHSDNMRAIASYNKVGFTEFGRRRECRYIDGRYLDTVYMEITATNYIGQPLPKSE
jgi:RimJ/RimL family protein N-acetyltransferase